MKKILFFLVVGTAGLSSCTLQPDLAELVKNMVVVTYYDETTLDTATYQTFYLRMDTLGFVSNRYTDTIVHTRIQNVFFETLSEIIPARLRSEMMGVEFSPVDLKDAPDLIVNAVILDNLNITLSYNYPSYYSGYYGYYGYYYPYYSLYTAQYGTLLIEVLDAKNYQANGNKYKVIWNIYIGDLYTSLDSYAVVEQAIKQAFIQSPYIHAN